MRPIYERQADRERQDAIMRAFCDCYGCDAVVMPALCAWDYEIRYCGEIVAVAEIKTRSKPATLYPHFMVKEEKVQMVRAEGERRGIAPLLLVNYPDLRAWARLDRVEYSTGMGGRWDRGDPADVEMMAYIPLAYFTPF
jgi:hypothetical protein